MAKLTEKQSRIMMVLAEVFSSGDSSVSAQELAFKCGISGSSIAATLRSLSFRGEVGLATGTAVRGAGTGLHVIWCRNPKDRSSILAPEDLIYDSTCDVWRFASDITPEDKITRACLNCGCEFHASSKFVRFCDHCKSSDEWAASASTGGYLSNGAAILTGSVGGFQSPSSTAIHNITKYRT